MSIWDHLFDSDWNQRSDINDLDRRSADLSRRISRSQATLRKEIDDLKEQVAALCLFNRTLLNALVKKGVLAEDEFVINLDELDNPTET